MGIEQFLANIRLNMEPEEFEGIRSDFVRDLAAILKVDEREIIIVSIIRHCTDIKLQIPLNKRELFNFVVSRDNDLPEEEVDYILNFQRKYKVMLPIKGAPAYLRGRGPVITNSDEGRGITWLHLSDSHFESPATGKGVNFWGQDKTRSVFVEQVPELLAQERLSPDYVYFTGDIAQSGKPEEYDVALDFIKALRNALSPTKQAIPIFSVPGNHDVDRSLASEAAQDKLAEMRKGENFGVIRALQDPAMNEFRESVFKRQGAYFDFAKRAITFGQPPTNRRYFFTTARTHHNVKVGIAGLNSAWLSGSDRDAGNLVLGVPQIDWALTDISDSDLKLLLIHHPPESDWFQTSDKLYQRQQLRKFDFVLRGHEHDPHTGLRALHGHGEYAHISAGALYSHGSHQNSFNVVHVDFDQGVAFVFFWRLSNRTLRWMKDTEVYPLGHKVVWLSEGLAEKLRQGSGLRDSRRQAEGTA
jgi:predicted MPP superfamily phosphohydrolase